MTSAQGDLLTSGSEGGDTNKAMMLYPKLNPKSAYGPTLYQGPTNSQPGHPGQIEKITG